MYESELKVHLSENLTFLFNKNREENGLTISHFLKFARVSHATVSRWRHGGNIAKKNVESIVDYFNRQLNLCLTPADLLEKDLSRELNCFRVGEPPSPYPVLASDPLTARLIRRMERLTTAQKEALLKILEAFE